MAEFNFDFDEVQRQLSYANLTDEQVLKLITTLQTKRATKDVQLTPEERVFYQCCRERRSFSQNKDIDLIVCPKCGSVHISKNGTRNGKQRYRCKDCGRTFGDTNGTVIYRSKMSINKWMV